MGGVDDFPARYELRFGGSDRRENDDDGGRGHTERIEG